MSEKISHIVSPLEITLEWKRSIYSPSAVLSLAAFELKKRSDKVEDFESIVYLGTKLNECGKAASGDSGVLLDVLDTADNLSPSGSCRMFIDFGKVKYERIKLLAYIIPLRKDNVLSFCDCTQIVVSMKDSSGQGYSKNLVGIATKAGMMAFDLGIFKQSRSSWNFEEELYAYNGGFEQPYELLSDKKSKTNHPFNVDTVLGDLNARIRTYYKEYWDRYNIWYQENKARLEAEAAKRKAEERLRFEQEMARIAAEEARLKAEEDARLKAEEDARRLAEEQARIAEEQQRLAEEKRIKAEEEAKKKAEEQKVAQEELEQADSVAQQNQRKTKAWKSARTIRHSEEQPISVSELQTELSPETLSSNSPVAEENIRNLGGSKKWKTQVGKMHVSTAEENKVPSSIPIIPTPENKKHKFPKVKR